MSSFRVRCLLSTPFPRRRRCAAYSHTMPASTPTVPSGIRMAAAAACANNQLLVGKGLGRYKSNANFPISAHISFGIESGGGGGVAMFSMAPVCTVMCLFNTRSQSHVVCVCVFVCVRDVCSNSHKELYGRVCDATNTMLRNAMLNAFCQPYAKSTAAKVHSDNTRTHRHARARAREPITMRTLRYQRPPQRRCETPRQ